MLKHLNVNIPSINLKEIVLQIQDASAQRRQAEARINNKLLSASQDYCFGTPIVVDCEGIDDYVIQTVIIQYESLGFRVQWESSCCVNTLILRYNEE